jgi:hypothetical protein
MFSTPFGDTAQSAVEDNVVERRGRAPVDASEQAPWVEEGRLAHGCGGTVGRELVLEPAAARHDHLGAEPQKARPLDLLDAPPFEVIAFGE